MINGTLMDYANDEHFNSVLDRYGGENYLKKNFPHILQMIYDTRELHKSKEYEERNNEQVGYVDTFRITELPMQELNQIENKIQSAIYANSFMTMVKPHPFLMLVSDISDPKHGKIFGGYAVYNNEGINKFGNNQLVDSSYLNYSKEPSVETKTNFQVIDNVEGKDVVYVDIDKVCDMDISNLNKIVKNITVNAPRPKTDSATYIRVVYNGRTDNDAAYNFIKAKDSYIGKTRYVNVYYPFSIHVEFDELYEINTTEPVSFDSTFNLSIASDVIEGGEVHFNTAYIKNISTEIEGNILKFNFPYSNDTQNNYWGVDMPLTAKQAEGYFDFHLNFTVNFRLKGTQKYKKTAIIVTSEQLPDSDNLRRIKQSRILWGCLGKDTLIRTENGYKKIYDISKGDKIFTDKGYIRLKNMVVGIEEKIVAVGVSEEKTLFITKNHPIKTDRGIIRAIDLAATDKLMVEDGTFKDIFYLEVKEYNDKVYCPELEEYALISANGIMVGDYLTPVKKDDETDVEPHPLNPELVEELKKWVFLKNKQLQKEVSV